MKVKLTLVFEDVEYMRALADGIGRCESNVYIELGSMNTSIDCSRDKVILTDFSPDSFDEELLQTLRRKIVFLSADRELVNIDDESRPFVLYKYSPISRITAEIGFVIGESSLSFGGRGGSVKELVTVCCDGNNHGAIDFARRLAGQILYRTGDEVAIIPLVNYPGWNAGSVKRGTVRKLLLYILNDRRFDGAMMFIDDETGVGRFVQDDDFNPLAEAGLDVIMKIVEIASEHKYRRIVAVCGDRTDECVRGLVAESRLVFWLDESGCETAPERLRRITEESGHGDFVQLRMDGLKIPLDVWIDDYCARRYAR